MWCLLVLGDAWAAWRWGCWSCDWQVLVFGPGAPAPGCSCATRDVRVLAGKGST